jgi:hypothetical protein
VPGKEGGEKAPNNSRIMAIDKEKEKKGERERERERERENVI